MATACMGGILRMYEAYPQLIGGGRSSYLTAGIKNAADDVQGSGNGLIGLAWRLLCSFLLCQKLKVPLINQVLSAN